MRLNGTEDCRGIASRLVLLFCVGAFCASVPRLGANEPSKPNIMVIFTDDHGYSDLSCQGIQNDIRTPHIDALAAGGARMTSGYVTAPQCVPSRAGLLTGRYQNRFGVESNGEPLDGFNGQRTIAERLKDAGYATGMTGKWHLGPAPEIVMHGFDDVYYKNANRPGWANFDLDGNDRAAGAEDSDLYHLDANSAATCAFIKRHHSEPFFFYCAYRAPHVPLDAPPKYLNRFPGEMPERRRQALAMISAIDDGVGRILKTLREYGIEEKTLIFLIGDNGAPLKIHKLDAPGGGPGWDGSLNDPLNGEKGMLAEGGIRVPFVAYWKNTIPYGLVYSHPVISLDVAATAVALAGSIDEQGRPSRHESSSMDGAENDTAGSLDGVNLIPYLRGEAEGSPHETLYWRWIAQSAVREGKWKYLRGGRREYLFDLDSDREEACSVLKDYPKVAERLRARLTTWSDELQPPGLETKQMSETWELYFDHYLDGKPAAKPSSQRNRDWLTRSGTAELGSDGLRVRPSGTSKRVFIVMAQLDLPAQSTAVVRLKPIQAGGAGIAWREAGQKDFSTDQVVKFDCPRPDQWQENRLAIPAGGRVIHVRLLLPEGGADIESIEFRDLGDKVLRAWRFGESRRLTQ